MAGKLDTIIKVTITRQTSPVEIPSFDIILIAGVNWTFGGRYKLYSTSDLAAIAADLTLGTADPEYLAASAIASQNPRPAFIAGGRKDGGDADYGVTLAAVALENSEFYGVIGATRVVSEQEEITDWTQANKRYAMFASAGTDIGGGVMDIIDEADGVDDSSIAYYLKNNTIDRASAFYHLLATSDYLDAGAMGALLIKRPGTYTAMFKQVSGSSVDTLTPTQQANLFAKFGNSYELVAARNMIQEGWVGTGEFMDLIVWIDWLEAQVQTNLFALLSNQDKIPFTDPGILTIENNLRQTLQVEQDVGAITPHNFDDNNVRTGGFDVRVPAASSILLADKTARILKNVEFDAYYETPIHRVWIDGVVRL